MSFRPLATLLVVAALLAPAASMAADDAACPPLLNHTFPTLQDEKPQSLCQWKGKVLLVVNTADLPDFFGPLIPGKRLPGWRLKNTVA